MRGDALGRQWDILFYLANTAPLFISTTEIFKSLETDDIIKTVYRDLLAFYNKGFLERQKRDRKIFWRYIGPLKPFTNHGKFWCTHCKEFKAEKKMETVNKFVYRCCIECHNEMQRQHYKRNRKYHLKRQHKYYMKKSNPSRRNKSKYNSLKIKELKEKQEV